MDSDKKEALIHMATPVVTAAAMNGLIFAKGWSKIARERLRENKFLPPGPVIGMIWTGQFALMGYVHYLLRRASNPASWLIVGLFGWCLAYPGSLQLMTLSSSLSDSVDSQLH